EHSEGLGDEIASHEELVFALVTVDLRRPHLTGALGSWGMLGGVLGASVFVGAYFYCMLHADRCVARALLALALLFAGVRPGTGAPSALDRALTARAVDAAPQSRHLEELTGHRSTL